MFFLKGILTFCFLLLFLLWHNQLYNYIPKIELQSSVSIKNQTQYQGLKCYDNIFLRIYYECYLSNFYFIRLCVLCFLFMSSILTQLLKLGLHIFILYMRRLRFREVALLPQSQDPNCICFLRPRL